VLAYISWHTPARDTDTAAYEQALEHFHRSLAHRPPSGLRGSAVFRAPAPPWTGPVEAAHVYEDWYLLDSWSSVGVLEEAAVARAIRARITPSPRWRHLDVLDLPPERGRRASRPGERGGLGQPRPRAILADARRPARDGMDGESAGLWRRCLGSARRPSTACWRASLRRASRRTACRPDGSRSSQSARSCGMADAVRYTRPRRRDWRCNRWV